MVFVKVVKNKAYFRRFQTQFRRRREGKTDYRARLRLVIQDKNKYNSPKYRFIVRFTNKDIICQIAYAKIDGDHVLAAAYSHELPRYGIKLGLTNYSAAYATGLLLARRVLTKLNLASKYEGQKKVTGEDYNVEPMEDGPRPFKALLDVGLSRTSTGSRLFAALKGMCDGGVDVPHSDTRLVGYSAEKQAVDAAVLRKYIFGGHVAAYMKRLLEQDQAAYDRQFSRYKKEGITADMLEKIYTEAHKKIRADPSFTKKAPKAKPAAGVKAKTYAKRPLTLAERKNRIAQKKVRYGYPEALAAHGIAIPAPAPAAAAAAAAAPAAAAAAAAPAKPAAAPAKPAAAPAKPAAAPAKPAAAAKEAAAPAKEAAAPAAKPTKK